MIPCVLEPSFVLDVPRVLAVIAMKKKRSKILKSLVEWNDAARVFTDIAIPQWSVQHHILLRACI